MKYYKRLLGLLLAVILVFSIASCKVEIGGTDPTPDTSASPTPPLAPNETLPTLPNPADITPTPVDYTVPSPSASFADFVESYLVTSMLGATVNIHFYFKNPQNYGFPAYNVTWGSGYAYPSDDELNYEVDMTRALLANYNRAELTRDEQFVYDLMLYDWASLQQSLDLYYYREPLLTGIGDHIQIPLILGEYKFQSEQDIKDYFALLVTIDDYFDSIIAFENEKSRLGLFMADGSLDTVITECTAFIVQPETNAMLSAFADNMENLEFDLSEGMRQAYIDLNRTAVLDYVIPAYEKLIDGVEVLRGTGVNEIGLAGLPRGTEYAALELNSFGISMSPEDYIEKLDEAIAAVRDGISAFAPNANETSTIADLIDDIVQNNMSLLTAFWELGFPELTAEETVEYLREHAAADFPALPTGTAFTIKHVDPSQEDAARPAMYFSPQVDNAASNTIIVNDKALADDAAGFFTTMAHEGYPGHLQQFAGISAQHVNTLRMIYKYDANAEGWATYAELYAVKYLGGDEDAREFLRLYNEFNLYLSARLEMGVSYEGWTRQMYARYGMDLYGDELGGYDYFRDAPMTYAQYIAGMMQIRALRAEFSDISDLQFHTDFLNAGSVPFIIMEEYLSELYALG